MVFSFSGVCLGLQIRRVWPRAFRAYAGRIFPSDPNCDFVSHAGNSTIGSNFCQARMVKKTGTAAPPAANTHNVHYLRCRPGAIGPRRWTDQRISKKLENLKHQVPLHFMH
jgi:hypothetical protein